MARKSLSRLSQARLLRKTRRCFESLEERRLLTISSNFSAGVLDIDGSATAEDIVISVSSGNVRINGAAPQSGTVAASNVTHISVTGGTGNTLIDLSAVTLSAFSALEDTDITLADAAGTTRTVYGSEATDLINGSSLNDTLHGGGGNDEMFGGDGNDTLNGGDGVDYLAGGAGNDTLSGDADGDTIDGEAGHDTLNGGDGDDFLFGRTGVNTLTGGNGDDVYLYVDGNTQISDTINESASGGNDTVDFLSLDFGAGITLDLSWTGTYRTVIDAGTQKIIMRFGGAGNQVEGIQGTIYGDHLYGNSLDNTIAGGNGDGDDVITGGAGNDWLGGSLGDDDIDGGDGDDIVSGFHGNDVLLGGAGQDELNGGDGNDELDGGGDDDELNGGAGDDDLVGGAGNDLYVTNLGHGQPYEADTFDDSVVASGGLYDYYYDPNVISFDRTFVFDTPSSGAKFSFALTEGELTDSYGDPNTSEIWGAELTYGATGVQSTWGRIFNSSGDYSTYRNDFYLLGGFEATGDGSVEATELYTLTLATENIDPNLDSDWVIDWGDGSSPTVLNSLNLVAGSPLEVTHTFPSLTTVRNISVTVSARDATLELPEVTVQVIGDEPLPPTSFSLSTSGDSGFRTYNWVQPSVGTAVEKYDVDYSTNGTTWSNFSEPTVTSFQHRVLEKFYYRIRAKGVNGLFSEWAYYAPKFDAEDRVVPLSAEVESSPPKITLHWSPDLEADSISVYRRAKGTSSWGSALATLSGSTTSYEDTNVTAGIEYEYRVSQSHRVGTALQSITANGYIASGIEVAVEDERGTIVLVIDDTFTTSLAAEIARLQQDLNGDGWKVIVHEVSRTGDTAVDVKALIKGSYDLDPTGVKQVLLLGHVPVPYSGNLAPDGHGEHVGAWPADVYYGDMNGTWTDAAQYNDVSDWPIQFNDPNDGKFDHNDLQSNRTPELAVGRVDMWNLGASYGLTELQMLKRYLDRDHAFRQGEMNSTIPQRGIVMTRLSNVSPLGGVNGFGNFTALVGESNVVMTNNFLSQGRTGALWGYVDAYGSSQFTGMDVNVANSAQYLNPTSGQEMDVVFTISYGSYFGDWNTPEPNNFLRAVLGGAGSGLVSLWGGTGYWGLHGMGMGDTIGEAHAFTLNGGLTPVNQFSIVHGLMGDPSLRMRNVLPPTNVTITPASGDQLIEWTASADPNIESYRIYRGTSANDLVYIGEVDATEDEEYLDTPPGAGPYVYMVRAVKLEVGNSGSYYNASQGAFAYMLEASIASTFSQNEGNAGTMNFVITVTLSMSFGEAVTVEFETRTPDAGTVATEGVDYTATSGTLTFAATQTTATITISVAGNGTVEDDEDFLVVLKNPRSSDILSLGEYECVVTILNDD